MSLHFAAMRTIRRPVMLASFCLLVGSISFLVGMLIWAYRLDADFSARYQCCTQEVVAAFHNSFWWRFSLVEKLGFVGCLGLAATLTSKNVLKLGTWLVAASPLLWLINFIAFGADWEGWSGATAATTAIGVFCAGASLLVIGGIRIGWSRLRS
jgi:hypothetical protein